MALNILEVTLSMALPFSIAGISRGTY